MCEGGLITGEHPALPARSSVQPPARAVDHTSGAATNAEPDSGAAGVDLKSMERSAIEKALSGAKYNKSKAAKMLGLTRTQLYVRLRKYGLE